MLDYVCGRGGGGGTEKDQKDYQHVGVGAVTGIESCSPRVLALLQQYLADVAAMSFVRRRFVASVQASATTPLMSGGCFLCAPHDWSRSEEVISGLDRKKSYIYIYIYIYTYMYVYIYIYIYT